LRKLGLVSISRIGFLVFLSLAFVFASVVFLIPNPVFADVPGVLSVDPWTDGTETILNITVRHFGPTSSHYVDMIQVDIDGTVENVNLDPQSINPFVMQYSMGDVSSEPSVRVRTHCNLHGWGSWTEPQVIPEFPSTLLILVILGVFAVTLIFYRGKVK
jgi:desulfoferrodoxin (superoxide reductase-like protein)